MPTRLTRSVPHSPHSLFETPLTVCCHRVLCCRFAYTMHPTTLGACVAWNAIAYAESRVPAVNAADSYCMVVANATAKAHYRVPSIRQKELAALLRVPHAHQPEHQQEYQREHQAEHQQEDQQEHQHGSQRAHDTLGSPSETAGNTVGGRRLATIVANASRAASANEMSGEIFASTRPSPHCHERPVSGCASNVMLADDWLSGGGADADEQRRGQGRAGQGVAAPCCSAGLYRPFAPRGKSIHRYAPSLPDGNRSWCCAASAWMRSAAAADNSSSSQSSSSSNDRSSRRSSRGGPVPSLHYSDVAVGMNLAAEWVAPGGSELTGTTDEALCLSGQLLACARRTWMAAAGPSLQVLGLVDCMRLCKRLAAHQRGANVSGRCLAARSLAHRPRSMVEEARGQAGGHAGGQARRSAVTAFDPFFRRAHWLSPEWSAGGADGGADGHGAGGGVASLTFRCFWEGYSALAGRGGNSFRKTAALMGALLSEFPRKRFYLKVDADAVLRPRSLLSFLARMAKRMDRIAAAPTSTSTRYPGRKRSPGPPEDPWPFDPRDYGRPEASITATTVDSDAPLLSHSLRAPLPLYFGSAFA